MWREKREKNDEYETESEEEVDIVEEANLILDTLEELEEERKLEDKIIETENAKENANEVNKKKKEYVKQVKSNDVKEIKSKVFHGKIIKSAVSDGTKYEVEGDKLDGGVDLDLIGPDLKSNNTNIGSLLSPSLSQASLSAASSTTSSLVDCPDDERKSTPKENSSPIFKCYGVYLFLIQFV